MRVYCVPVCREWNTISICKRKAQEVQKPISYTLPLGWYEYRYNHPELALPMVSIPYGQMHIHMTTCRMKIHDTAIMYTDPSDVPDREWYYIIIKNAHTRYVVCERDCTFEPWSLQIS